MIEHNRYFFSNVKVIKVSIKKRSHKYFYFQKFYIFFSQKNEINIKSSKNAFKHIKTQRTL